MSKENDEKSEVKEETPPEQHKTDEKNIEVLHRNSKKLREDSDESDVIVINTGKRKRGKKSETSVRVKRRKTIKIIINSDDDDDDNIIDLTKLDQKSSCETNIYDPSPITQKKKKGSLRPIFIDGSNVAFAHGKNKFFSVRGLQICIDYFRRRGHKVKAFVPNFRARRKHCSDSRWLQKLERKNLVVFTPSLTIKNESKVPYDDWYVVQMAAKQDGIIVSRDNFQDIARIEPKLRFFVEERRLVPTFVDDTIIFPMDPLGNRDYNLDEFLRY
ncbi:unnamed protein product [Brassicogethes aeneus]|uniref:RNase NYN domain-containing protein n=1 Tax=Brassicogethes aeneus TaxID=1431903 RepID=A0A9P0AYS4_BRAAE|nr:unnamed protein product [Brassicogethes aeneus]